MKIALLIIFAVVIIAAGCAPLSTEPSVNRAAENTSNTQASASPARSSANSAPAKIVPFPEVPRITLADAKKAFDDGSAVFIDTHSKEMFDNEHIRSAINIPFNEMDSHLDKVPKNKTVITYCSCPAENTSAAVAEQLIQKGQKDVLALEGGTNAWKMAGYPMDKKTN